MRIVLFLPPELWKFTRCQLVVQQTPASEGCKLRKKIKVETKRPLLFSFRRLLCIFIQQETPVYSTLGMGHYMPLPFLSKFLPERPVVSSGGKQVIGSLPCLSPWAPGPQIWEPLSPALPGSLPSGTPPYSLWNEGSSSLVLPSSADLALCPTVAIPAQCVSSVQDRGLSSLILTCT